jgi:hypothetical protein
MAYAAGPFLDVGKLRDKQKWVHGRSRRIDLGSLRKECLEIRLFFFSCVSKSF